MFDFCKWTDLEHNFEIYLNVLIAANWVTALILHCRKRNSQQLINTLYCGTLLYHRTENDEQDRIYYTWLLHVAAYLVLQKLKIR